MSRTYKGAVRTSGYLKSPATVGGIHVSSSSSLMSAKFLKENDGRTVTNIEEMMQRVAGLTCKEKSVREFNEGMERLFGSTNDFEPEAYPMQRRFVSHTSQDQPRLDHAGQLTHVGPTGHASMVDVGSKQQTSRGAIAAGRVCLGSQAFQAVKENNLAKGDVLGVARLAGIMAAKQTSNLIPLCHSLSLDRVSVDLTLNEADQAVDITAEARCEGKTGVEMEAMTAASVAALTVYDMTKAVSKGIEIQFICLQEKWGGKSGHWRRKSS